jgi:hypothetical protein
MFNGIEKKVRFSWKTGRRQPVGVAPITAFYPVSSNREGFDRFQSILDIQCQIGKPITMPIANVAIKQSAKVSILILSIGRLDIFHLREFPQQPLHQTCTNNNPMR